MAHSEKVSANTPWTVDELRQSVEVYVLLLRLQLSGGDGRSESVAQALLSGPLALRNEAAIRYRMRNISAVVQEMDGPMLKGFSPAESVGKLVRPRIRAMLLNDPDFARLLAPTPNAGDDDRGDALKALAILRRQIEELEADLAWRRHNGPPEQEDVGIEGADLQDAREAVTSVEAELAKLEPDTEAIKAGISRILGLALKLTKWIGERTTKFVDAVLVAVAPVVVAKVTGLLPAIINAVEAVGRAVGH
ncbi:hypothetical protein Q9295_16240 [Xinfangfangia sp. CPCC 101601]|uniref:Uncharacterized protein n=1 Tax=Pseudogemmobacter lacusdianii TaxID=3069608 RepID=A0ABU0W1T0_9RHOB|nr:hypothetical protein [Xinfangfangia sp. CPCC 101601]MDQ2067926.1 hypothetical protein [Xinfangfangia sp. CPCC 101601]